MTTQAGEVKPGDIAGPYADKDGKEQPRGLTLEKLRLRFQDNIDFAAEGQDWFKWGTTWSRHKVYATLVEFQSDLGMDTASQVFNLGFADLHQRDFRLSREIMPRLKESYLQGPVPGVTLGVGP